MATIFFFNPVDYFVYSPPFHDPTPKIEIRTECVLRRRRRNNNNINIINRIQRGTIATSFWKRVFFLYVLDRTDCNKLLSNRCFFFILNPFRHFFVCGVHKYELERARAKSVSLTTHHKEFADISHYPRSVSKSNEITSRLHWTRIRCEIIEINFFEKRKRNVRVRTQYRFLFFFLSFSNRD